MRTLIAILLALILIPLPSYLYWSWTRWNFPTVVSAYYAKEFCSCVYIEKRGEKACHEYAKLWPPVQNFAWNKEKKEVQVWALGRTSKAFLVSNQLGCRLNSFSK